MVLRLLAILATGLAAIWASNGSMIARTGVCPNGASVPPSGRCPIGPFVVFFESSSAAIGAQAEPILDTVAIRYREFPGAPVLLSGHTDRRGAQASNLLLSLRRAEAVRRYLAARGVRDEAMSIAAHGEKRPLIETADGVTEPQNRRVEIAVDTEAPR